MDQAVNDPSQDRENLLSTLLLLLLLWASETTSRSPTLASRRADKSPVIGRIYPYTPLRRGNIRSAAPIHLENGWGWLATLTFQRISPARDTSCETPGSRASLPCGICEDGRLMDPHFCFCFLRDARLACITDRSFMLIPTV